MMMGLHQTINTRWKTILIWYQAVNERGGRWHMWEVPVYIYDKSVVRANQAERFSYHREDLITRYETLGWSEFLEAAPPQNARRMCNTRQTVHRWSRRWGWSGINTPRPDPTSPRGWCSACWDVYLANHAQVVRDSQRMANWSNRTHGSRMTLSQQGAEWQAQVDAR